MKRIWMVFLLALMVTAMALFQGSLAEAVDPSIVNLVVGAIHI